MPRTETRPLPPVTPDTGCRYAPRCLTCPWRACIRELPAPERLEFDAAWQVLAGYVAPPDRALARG